jgi:diguanylate cyclase (GGDEF)-like protein
VRDRRVLGSIAAGFAALIAGIAASVADLPEVALVAGACGFVAAICATAIGAALRSTGDELVATRTERDALRRELDALAAIFADEASSARGETLPLANPYPEAIVDTASGLLDERHYKVLVTKRLAAARRALQPISIVIFEVDDLEHASAAECDAVVGALGEIITETLRESDAACRLGRTMASAILEDTAEAGAVWAAERIRGALHQVELGNRITVSAGIACYPSHALSALELMDRAQRALDHARSQGRDRLEVASAD